MIDIEVKRARNGNKVKIVGRVYDDADPTIGCTMSATVNGGILHLYSPGFDMTTAEWTLLASKIDNEIALMERRGSEAEDATV